MKKNIFWLSLCIPTYGVSEWFFPVLDSIYKQADRDKERDFEVVITDNGNNEEFTNKVNEFQKKHENLVYKKTDAKLFLNEIESYKLARGTLLKFINHRTILRPGALAFFIDFAKENYKNKPVTYFANGVLYKKPEHIECSSFGSFLDELGYWSSWSTGMAIWKDDFDRLDLSKPFNELFPHTTILFSQTKKDKYVINNKKLLTEINAESIKKGKYDLFHAFAVEYPAIFCDLYRNNDIDLKTFLKLKDHALEDVTRLFWRFIVKREPCSYDLSGFNGSLRVFYSKRAFVWMLAKCMVLKIARKIKLK